MSSDSTLIESADTCTTMPDLEDGELPSSDEEMCDDKKDDKQCSNGKRGNSVGHRDSISSNDNEQVDENESKNDRKRPFESPEPPEESKDVPCKRPKCNSDDSAELEDGEIYSDDEEAMYYPSKMVKSRSPPSASKPNATTKSSPPPKRYQSRSRSRSPVPRERFASNRSSYNRSNFDKKTNSPSKTKDHQHHHKGSGNWKDQHGGRSKGKIHHIHAGKHNNRFGGGKTSSKWAGDDGLSNQLTLETLENRLKNNLAILPTPPNATPCYSLDEFNYPATPQWYFRAIANYNKKMGYKPKGRGSGQPEDGGGVSTMTDGLGYQQMNKPHPPGYQGQPIVAPPTNSNQPPPLPPVPLNQTGSLIPDNVPPIMGMRPPNLGMRPPNIGLSLPNMGPGLMGARPNPAIINMGIGPPNIGIRPPFESPPITVVPPPPINIPPQPNIGPPSVELPNAPQSGPPSVPQLAPSSLPTSVPVTVVSSSDDHVQPSTMVTTDVVVDDDTTMSGELVIDKGDEDPLTPSASTVYQDISPSSSPGDVTMSPINDDSQPSSVNVSTEYTKSLGRRGGRQSVMGHGTTATKSGSSRQSKTLKKLVVSVDLKKVSVGSSLLLTNDDDDYDDYLNQLNDEEEDESTDEVKPDHQKPSTFDSNLFWIDTTAAQSDSKDYTDSTCSSIDQKDLNIDSSNPLDEDFPVIGSGTGADTETGMSLRSLVDESGDGKIKGKQGEDENYSDKVGGGKRLKKAEKSYWTKKNKIEKKQQKQQQKQQQQQQQKQQLPNFNVKQQQKQDALSQQPNQPLPCPQSLESKGPPTQKLPQPCKYYLQGYCIHGENCQYDHSIRREKKREMCKFYLQDICDKGNDCVFYHGDFPCRYFHGRHMCFHGEKCKFSHAPLTVEGYELLMGVLEPNLRDQVPFPGQTPAGNPASITPSPHSNNSMTGSVQPPLDSNAPIPFHPAAVPPLAPTHPNNHPAPAPGIAPYPQSQSLNPHSQQPQPHNIPQPHSQSIPHPHSHTPETQSDPPDVPTISCNVKLPKSFNIESLFPNEHPQVLPHDLATQLREVLLDTPSSTRDEDKKKQEEAEEKYELYYWENKEKGDTNSSSGPPPPWSHTPVPGAHNPVPNDPPPTYNKIDRSEVGTGPPSYPQPIPPSGDRDQGGVSMLRPPFEPHPPMTSPPQYPVPDPRQVGGPPSNMGGRRLSPDPRRERDPRHDPSYDPRSIAHDPSYDPRSIDHDPSYDPRSIDHDTSTPSTAQANHPYGHVPPRADSYSGPHSNTPPFRADPYSGSTVPPRPADYYSDHSGPYPDVPPPRAGSYSGPHSSVPPPRADPYSDRHSNVPPHSNIPPHPPSRADPYSGPYSNVPPRSNVPPHSNAPLSRADPYFDPYSSIPPHSNIPPRADSYSGPHSSSLPPRVESYSDPHSNVPPRADPYSNPNSNVPDSYSGPDSNAAPYYSHAPPPRADPYSGPHSNTQPPRAESYSVPHPSVDHPLRTDPYSSPHSNVVSHSNSYPSKAESYPDNYSNFDHQLRADSYEPHSHVIPSRSDSQSNPSTSGYTIPRTSHSKSPPPITSSSTSSNEIISNHKQISSRLADPRKKYSQFKIKSKSSQSETATSTKPTPSTAEPLPKLLRDSSVLDKPIAPKDLFNTPFTGGSGSISIFGSQQQLSGDNDDTHEYGEIKLRRDSVTQQEPAASMDESDGNQYAISGGDPVPAVPSYMTGISHDEEDDSLHIDSAFGSLQNRKRRLSELTSTTNNDRTE